MLCMLFLNREKNHSMHTIRAGEWWEAYPRDGIQQKGMLFLCHLHRKKKRILNERIIYGALSLDLLAIFFKLPLIFGPDTSAWLFWSAPCHTHIVRPVLQVSTVSTRSQVLCCLRHTNRVGRKAAKAAPLFGRAAIVSLWSKCVIFFSTWMHSRGALHCVCVLEALWCSVSGGVCATTLEHVPRRHTQGWDAPVLVANFLSQQKKEKKTSLEIKNATLS